MCWGLHTAQVCRKHKRYACYLHALSVVKIWKHEKHISCWSSQPSEASGSYNDGHWF